MILTKKKLDELFLEHPSLDDEAPIVIKTLCTTEQKDKFWIWDIAVHDSDGSLKLEVVRNNTPKGQVVAAEVPLKCFGCNLWVQRKDVYAGEQKYNKNTYKYATNGYCNECRDCKLNDLGVPAEWRDL